ncbi:MAG: hypothetical protein DDT32_02137 [Syntrophomonadaceae bacterium]|nr:hypothetical protein [Bacillota bacterium]
MAYEVNYYPKSYGIVLYAVGDLEDLPNLEQVIGRGSGVGTLYYERLGGFRNLAEAREFCRDMGYPMPVESCVPGW